MKKSDIIDLIRYHSENNENGFRSVAYLIADEFDRAGDIDLAKYIMSLLSVSNIFVPRASNIETPYLQKLDTSGGLLLIPDSITNDIRGILNAVRAVLAVYPSVGKRIGFLVRMCKVAVKRVIKRGGF